MLIIWYTFPLIFIFLITLFIIFCVEDGFASAITLLVLGSICLLIAYEPISKDNLVNTYGADHVNHIRSTVLGGLFLLSVGFYKILKTTIRKLLNSRKNIQSISEDFKD
jgi:cellobiose-specific phosphotransferase system component IIC